MALQRAMCLGSRDVLKVKVNLIEDDKKVKGLFVSTYIYIYIYGVLISVNTVFIFQITLDRLTCFILLCTRMSRDIPGHKLI